MTFAFTTLVDELGGAIALIVILALSVAADLVWKRRRERLGATGLSPDPA